MLTIMKAYCTLVFTLTAILTARNDALSVHPHARSLDLLIDVSVGLIKYSSLGQKPAHCAIFNIEAKQRKFLVLWVIL